MIDKEKINNNTEYIEDEGDSLCEEHIASSADSEEHIASSTDSVVPDLVSAYFTEIGSHTMLKPGEEFVLAKQMREGGELGKEAEEKLIVANLRLVVHVAKQYQNRRMDMMDIIQYGNMGLMTAVKRFDYTKGNRFSTYATWWIRQSINRNLENYENPIRLPAYRTADLTKIFRARNELRAAGKREPTNKEIAEKLSMSEKKLEEALNYYQAFVSIDDTVKNDDNERTSLAGFLVDAKAKEPEEIMMEKAKRDTIMSVLDELPGKEKDVLIRRFGLNGDKPEILEKIALDYGLTRERIRQIEEKALERLRAPKYKKRLKDFVYS